MYNLTLQRSRDEYQRLNSSLVKWTSDRSLPRLMTREEHSLMMNLLQTLTALLESRKVTYFMTDGTLLGSYFSHDILPWDDDVDLLVNRHDLPLVSEKSLKIITFLCVVTVLKNMLYFLCLPTKLLTLINYICIM